MIGQTISHYRIVEKLGSGKCATVASAITVIAVRQMQRHQLG